MNYTWPLLLICRLVGVSVIVMSSCDKYKPQPLLWISVPCFRSRCWWKRNDPILGNRSFSNWNSKSATELWFTKQSSIRSSLWIWKFHQNRQTHGCDDLNWEPTQSNDRSYLSVYYWGCRYGIPFFEIEYIFLFDHHRWIRTRNR